ncbi:hypothetical protein [Parasediminibacterium sp. JCM 36343]|uniref:hypothetical protein n=1 Tax=Parasediminibacterium sp. JCM 36343 TaxID=3374279 RepID=UPI00397D05CD
MRSGVTVLALAFALCATVFIACSKKGSDAPSTCKLINFTQGLDPQNDTSFEFNYDAHNNISKIAIAYNYYSFHHFDTAQLYYSNSRLDSFRAISQGGIQYIYSSNNLLSAIKSDYGAVLAINYNNNQPTLITNSFGSITYDSLFFNADGDITAIKEFDYTKQLSRVIAFQYSAKVISSTDKALALINSSFPNTLFGHNIGNFSGGNADFVSKYFGKHYINSFSSHAYLQSPEFMNGSCTYKFDNNGNIVSYVIKSTDTLTYTYKYTCN